LVKLSYPFFYKIKRYSLSNYIRIV